MPTSSPQKRVLGLFDAERSPCLAKAASSTLTQDYGSIAAHSALTASIQRAEGSMTEAGLVSARDATSPLDQANLSSVLPLAVGGDASAAGIVTTGTGVEALVSQEATLLLNKTGLDAVLPHGGIVGSLQENIHLDTLRRAAADPRAFAMSQAQGLSQRVAARVSAYILPPALRVVRKVVKRCSGADLELDEEFCRNVAEGKVEWDTLVDVEGFVDRACWGDDGRGISGNSTGSSQGHEQWAKLAHIIRSSLVLQTILEGLVLAQRGLPLFFTSIQGHALNLAPVIALGHLSTTALAASTIATMVVSVTGYSIVNGLASALDHYTSSPPEDEPSNSKRDMDTDKQQARMWYLCTALLTATVLAPILAIWQRSESLLLSLGQDPKVARFASEYLTVVASGLPAFAFGEIFRRYLALQGMRSIYTRALTTMTPLNMLLNYLLVNGPESLRLGFVGAPLTTAVTYNAIALLVVLGYVRADVQGPAKPLPGGSGDGSGLVDTGGSSPASSNTGKAFAVPLDALSRMDSAVASPSSAGTVTMNTLMNMESTGTSSAMESVRAIGDWLRLCLHGIVKCASECWSKELSAFIVSMLGPTALAAQAVLMATASTVYHVPQSINTASSARVEKLLQKGDIPRARMAVLVSLGATASSVFVLSNIVLASAPVLGEVFTSDASVLELTSAALPAIALFQAFHGMGAWVSGALGAFGKQLTLPTLIASADYFAGLPLGALLAIRYQWGLAGLWMGLTSSQIYACLVGVVILARHVSRKSMALISSPRGTSGADAVV